MARHYSSDFKQRALQLVQDHRLAHPKHSLWRTFEAVGSALGGVSPHTLSGWHKRRQVDEGEAQGQTTDEKAELKRLRKENAELRRTNEILKTASAFSQRNSTVPQQDDRLHRSVS